MFTVPEQHERCQIQKASSSFRCNALELSIDESPAYEEIMAHLLLILYIGSACLCVCVQYQKVMVTI